MNFICAAVNDEIDDEVDRRLAEARQQGGIDVERLARALTEHFGPSYFPGLHDVTIIGESPSVIAERLAEEYRAALASEPQEKP